MALPKAGYIELARSGGRHAEAGVDFSPSQARPSHSHWAVSRSGADSKARSLNHLGGRIGDSTIAPEQARGKVVIFAPPSTDASFAFWQRDNLRRYAGAKAIVIATLDLGTRSSFAADGRPIGTRTRRSPRVR